MIYWSTITGGKNPPGTLSLLPPAFFKLCESKLQSKIKLNRLVLTYHITNRFSSTFIYGESRERQQRGAVGCGGIPITGCVHLPLLIHI